MKKVKIGIIGLGMQGSAYFECITGKELRRKGFPHVNLEQLEVGAVCDSDPKMQNIFKQKFPQIPFYTDYIEMIESGHVDAIITTVPHYLHTKIGIEALKRNIHVLLEKPAGIYTKQVKEINDYAKTKPELTFAIMFNARTNPLFKRIKEIIDNGEIGDIRRFNWIVTTWYRPKAYYEMGEWRATWSGEGGGILVNQAPHQIDLMQWILGMPSKVFSICRYGFQRDIEVEDDVTALFNYDSGATGIFMTCVHDIVGTDRLEISGDKGRIVVEGSKKAEIIRFSKPESQVSKELSYKEVIELTSGGHTSKDFMTTEVLDFSSWEAHKKEIYQNMEIIENFVANIIDNTPLIAEGHEGINGVRLANAMHLSSWTGKEVSVNFDDELFYNKLKEKIDSGKK